MAYEVFSRKIARSGDPTISISSLGRIGINQHGAKYLRDSAVEFVVLLWDKDRHCMAIRPVTKKDSRAYTITYPPNGKGSGAGFSAKTFFDYINYDFSETRTLSADWKEEERLLEVEIPLENLKREKQPKLVMSAQKQPNQVKQIEVGATEL